MRLGSLLSTLFGCKCAYVVKFPNRLVRVRSELRKLIFGQMKKALLHNPLMAKLEEGLRAKLEANACGPRHALVPNLILYWSYIISKRKLSPPYGLTLDMETSAMGALFEFAA
jgi:hypothetical protein